MAGALSAADGLRRCVYLPVATPGFHAAGHLFRTDGVVVPLVAARDDALPGVHELVARLLEHLEPAA
jgi:hypothetical protein